MKTLILVVLVAGCFEPAYQDGGLLCGPGGACPSGYGCYQGACWTHEPQVVTPDAGEPETGVDAMPESAPIRRLFLEPCDVFGAGAPNRTDNCDTGLVCADGNVGAFCLRLCANSADCDGRPCERRQVDTQVSTNLYVCEMPLVACDPVALTGCPFNWTCYLDGAQTMCEIQSGDVVNGSCLHNRDCLPRYTCGSFGLCVRADGL